MGRGGSVALVGQTAGALPDQITPYLFFRGTNAPVFPEPSEQMIAELLERFQIPWEYEPRTFPLQYNEDGALTLAFCPDFYLPEQDLYIECTVMKQSLITRKNRKIRLTKEKYGVRIKCCNQRKMLWLAMRYGYDPDIYGRSPGTKSS